MADIHVCRYCGEHSFRAYDDMYRFGLRHYAHKKCYLERRGLEGLSNTQIESAPYADVKRLGLLTEVERRLAK